MKLGFIGLGRMGSNMVMNLMEHKHKVVGYNIGPEPTKKLVRKGMNGSYSLEELVGKLGKGRKVLWLMVPAGKPVDDSISNLSPHLRRGDIIVDGGNSFFKDSERRYARLKKLGIHYIDCGTSGGMEGARYGACMMVGGDKKVFKQIEVLFRDMCVKDGYGYMGKSGAGHFVKMVHNGIEYGMMGAIGEGMQAVKDSKFKPDMRTVAKVYAHGSIIESRLMSWLQKSYDTRGYLDAISGTVLKGETEVEMQNLEKMARMEVLTSARKERVRSRTKPTYAGKLTAAMRNQFGGHAVKKREKK
jgi:6-phosphogluconate dehydrogenase